MEWRMFVPSCLRLFSWMYLLSKVDVHSRTRIQNSLLPTLSHYPLSHPVQIASHLDWLIPFKQTKLSTSYLFYTNMCHNVYIEVICAGFTYTNHDWSNFCLKYQLLYNPIHVKLNYFQKSFVSLLFPKTKHLKAYQSEAFWHFNFTRDHNDLYIKQLCEIADHSKRRATLKSTRRLV